MSDAELRSYYEAEARQRLRPELRGDRVTLRSQFIDLLGDEDRRTVVDFGAGPGRDLAAFEAAGLRALGLDLAHGNGTLAAERGHTVVCADITRPPIRAGSFDAGWSMSTLMHLDDERVAPTVAAMADALTSGAPLWIAVWGGRRGVRIDETIAGERRPFHGRTLQDNAALIGRHARIDDVDVWQVGPGEYHVFRLRTP